jgi:phage terminase large subunit GpA-like protein
LAAPGASDPDAIALERRKRRVIRLKGGGSLTVEPYLVGGFGLKTVVYGMLATSLLAEKDRLPGGLYNPADATLEDFKQYASEVFKQPKSMRAGARGAWERLPGVSNERLDLAVYARGLAWFRGAYAPTAPEWQALFQSRAARQEAVLPLLEAAETPKLVPEAAMSANPGPEVNLWVL